MNKSIILVAAKAFATKHSITEGWKQRQHVGFVANLIKNECGITGAEEVQALLEILALTVNPSQFRQLLEKEGVLKPSSSQAQVLANEYLD